MNNHIINICYNNYYSGLSLDADVISNVLEKAGYTVYYNGYTMKLNGIPKIRKVYPKLLKTGLTALSYINVNIIAVNIHLEIIKEKNIRLAEKNIMIANLEWLREDSYSFLSKIDLFICKTRSAKVFFDERDFPAIYTSFSTISPYDSQYEQKPNTFVHIAGSSTEKGTVALAKLWSKHPEWPKLTILARAVDAQVMRQFEGVNIEVFDHFLEREELKRIQNEAEIHLCPSEVEGFGHYICEPLSCGAIVVTVDGYPMNELVQSERGILINVKDDIPMHYARKFKFDPIDFERKLEALLRMTKAEKKLMKSNAKNWFVRNDYFFRRKFLATIASLIEA